MEIYQKRFRVIPMKNTKFYTPRGVLNRWHLSFGTINA